MQFRILPPSAEATPAFIFIELPVLVLSVYIQFIRLIDLDGFIFQFDSLHLL
jgi:hypothetical protein